MAKQKPDPKDSSDGPPYPADWIVDESQRPEPALERHRRNAASPAVHEQYRAAVLEKAEKYGLIHVDPATGYRARFKPAEKAA